MATGDGSGPLTTNTTIQLSVAIVVAGAIFSGAWWASSISGKVDNIKTSSDKLETDMNNVKNDVSSIKFDVKSVQNSVNQISSETVRRK